MRIEIEFDWNDLFELVGRKIERRNILKILSLFKCQVVRKSERKAKIAIPIDRIDLLSTEGISRILRSYLKKEITMNIKTRDSNVKLYVTHDVLNIRPYVACAIIENVSLEKEALRQFHQYQEKIHNIYCRGKRKASIYIHDLDKISTPLTYTCKKPENIELTPMGEMGKMKAKQILANTIEGKRYAHLFFALEKYPVIIDSNGNVLSIPMITCSEETKVDEKTRNVFMEATGVEEKMVNIILNTAVANMIERGGNVRTVEILYPHKKILTPTLKNKTLNINIEYICKILNVTLSTERILELLRKSGYKAEIGKNNDVNVSVPYYRNDVFNEDDIIEDIILLYGFKKIKAKKLKVNRVIFNDEISRLTKKIKDTMIGLGYQEVITPSLMSTETLNNFLSLKAEPTIILVFNTAYPKINALRNWLLPGILKLLGENMNKKYPQKVFEVGYVTETCKKCNVKSVRILKIASAISNYKVKYEEIVTPLCLILKRIGVKFRFEPAKHHAFIPGRTARIIVGEKDREVEIGIAGEVHPQVSLKFKILNPIAAFELNLNKLFRLIIGRYDGAAEI